MATPAAASFASPPGKRPSAFISYSPTDKKWLDRLNAGLDPYVQNSGVNIWSDEKIPPGAISAEERKNALDQANLAILLVSPAFLESEFIRTHELSPLLNKAGRGELKLIWIPIHFSTYKHTNIAKYQPVWDPDRPLGILSKAKADQAFVIIADAIEKVLDS